MNEWANERKSAAEFASEMCEASEASEASEPIEASERVSVASEEANGQLSGPVPTSQFLADLNHSAVRRRRWLQRATTIGRGVENEAVWRLLMFVVDWLSPESR